MQQILLLELISVMGISSFPEVLIRESTGLV